MADTLQEFLVSIRYAVDSASQQNFLSQLGKTTASTLGLKLGIEGLAASVMALTEHVAALGDQYYWMSQRLGMSVLDIKDAAFAMSNLGTSSQSAMAAMERFSDWERAHGGASLAFLRMLGVTATDTHEQMTQIFHRLREMGGTYEFAHGTFAQRNAYARARALAESMGIDERTMLAGTSPDFDRLEQFSKGLYQSIGLNTAAMQAFAKSAHELSVQFSMLGQEWRVMRDAFGNELVKVATPAITRLVELIRSHMPEIVALLKAAADVVGFFVRVIAGAAEVMFRVVDSFEALFDQLQRLLPGLDIAKDALIAFGVALMLSPLGRFILLMETLLGLLDDWATYQRGGHSLINWGWIGHFSDEVDKITHVNGTLWDLAGALGAIAVAMRAIKLVGTLGSLLGLGGGGAGAAGGAAAAAASGSSPMLGALAKGFWVVVVAEAAQQLQPVLDQFAIAMHEKIKASVFGGKEYLPTGMQPMTPEQRQQENAKHGWLWNLVWGDLFNQNLTPPGSATPAAPAPDLPPLPGGVPPLIGEGQLPESRGDYGSRAFNPGNLNYAAWEGASGRFSYRDRQTGGMHTMAVFRSMQEGVAAVVKLLMRNQQNYGATLAGAFHGYAERPYFKDIARQLGIDPNAPLDISKLSPDTLDRLLEAGFRHEGRSMSSGALTHEMVLQGIDLARRGAPPGGRGTAAAGGVTLNQSTTISVAPGANAAETAHRVADQQGRVNETLVRNARGNLR